MNTINQKPRLGELDALRGFAAIMVVTFHLSMPFSRNISTYNIFRFGITGVDLFFIISGFVISMSINNVKTGKEFIINRFARLYPVYWICLSLSFLLQMIHFHQHNSIPRDSYIQYFVNFSMMQYYFKIPDMEGPYWTLIIELLFYLVVYMIYKLRQLHNMDFILFFVVILQLLLVLSRLTFPNIYLFRHLLELEALFPLLHFLSLFTIGVVFYKIMIQRISFFKVSVIAVCYIEQVFEYPERFSLATFNTNQWQYAIILGIYITLFFLFVNGKLSFIVSKATIFLGRISYPLYLFHQFLLLSILVPFFQERFYFPYLISSIFSIIIAIAIASIITIYLDEPLRYRVKKLLK